eukprot:CAMPEP_0201881726 /NCGR_PEP_ID=MMETSP0902-20130614/11941_1 /ASSEMBLY_ACC=CAM_ASM_000551 /TAXON_ID=420261 /ORGANISM="Thalassiosira antarctica, Strain CCMP982" /LENGTH=643 /DNA_ID=CAMNT_0048409989 /DNA_START=42 /DNA_END=1973 /DNA_ORIENTATION=-
MSSLFQKGSKKRKLPVPLTSETNDESGSGDISSGTNKPIPTNSRPQPTPSSSNRTSNTNSLTTTFADLGLCPPLVSTCRKLGLVRPTAVQRAIIPLILNNNPTTTDGKQQHHHILTLSATGSGKTAAFALPLLHLLSVDPYGIYALILTPTRELAKQIQQQILALGNGSGYKITCALIIGGEDVTTQNLELSKQPNFVVATPGRCAELCRDGGGGGGGLYKPNFRKVKFVVLDEADRLLCAKSGFERDVAEILLQSTTTMARDSDGTKRVRRNVCRTLLFSATMTRSLSSLEEMAGAGVGRLPLQKVVVREDGSWDDGKQPKKKKKKKITSGDSEEKGAAQESGNNDEEDDGESSDSEESDNGSTPNIPAGLRQEYIFMPSRVREAYLLCAIRTLMTHGGRGKGKKKAEINGSGWNNNGGKNVDLSEVFGDDNNDDEQGENDGHKSHYPLAQSAIIFVPTCERCAHISGILTELGIQNVALHSLLSQNRRLASLGTFQSQRIRVLVATDVASRGLDVPEVDLVINAELPRRAVDYVHRVGRTARAGRRGRAISLVGEQDIDLVHEAERISGRSLGKCAEVTDDMAVRLLGPVAKASRLTKMKLMDIGFDELVEKHRERKRRDRRHREKAERGAKKAMVMARVG